MCYLTGLIGLVTHARAEAPMNWTQVPGYYRMQLGQFEVTALFDGALDLDVKLLRNAESIEIDKMLARRFVGSPKMQTAVNGFLINTGKHIVLIDAGASNLYGPSLGFLGKNLQLAGYDSTQVDVVALTHLHGDHIGGLIDATGQPAFPKARIVVSQDESEYWLSPEIAAKSRVSDQRYFNRVRDIAGPYLSRKQWQSIHSNEIVVPGIRVLSTAGHTPGHVAYIVESDGQSLFIWGDLVHSHAVQFAKPEVSIEFDFDQKRATATRLEIMKAMAETRSLVAGMHLPFPGIGHVNEEKTGVFSWVPIEFSPLRRTHAN
jgi:glyoxylase-like metal-dependent hydrolase (beta-lactamase superfamily II)